MVQMKFRHLRQILFLSQQVKLHCFSASYNKNSFGCPDQFLIGVNSFRRMQPWLHFLLKKKGICPRRSSRCRVSFVSAPSPSGPNFVPQRLPFLLFCLVFLVRNQNQIRPEARKLFLRLFLRKQSTLKHASILKMEMSPSVFFVFPKKTFFLSFLFSELKTPAPRRLDYFKACTSIENIRTTGRCLMCVWTLRKLESQGTAEKGVCLVPKTIYATPACRVFSVY